MWESLSSWAKEFWTSILAVLLVGITWFLNKQKSDSETSKTKTDEWVALENWKKDQVKDLIEDVKTWQLKAERFEYMYLEMKSMYEEMKKERDGFQRRFNVIKNFTSKQ